MLKRKVWHIKIIIITKKKCLFKIWLRYLEKREKKKNTENPGMVKELVPFAVRKVSFSSEDLELSFL